MNEELIKLFQEISQKLNILIALELNKKRKRFRKKLNFYWILA